MTKKVYGGFKKNSFNNTHNNKDHMIIEITISKKLITNIDIL